jgi:uncharacterized membrane-anchored protein
MMRVLGVFAVMLALAGTASAERAKKATTKQADAKAAKQATPAADGSDAEPAAESPDAEQAAESPDAELTPEEVEASLPPHVNGPKLVDLGHDIQIDLPAGMLLLERDEARKMLEKGGDNTENVLGLVGQLDANWLVVIEYDDVGYVSDGDADKLDSNELLRSYEEGTKQQNARRKTLGVPELFLDGWSELPAYKRLQHHLVWGLKAHSTEGPVINFFTRILGRSGYMSVNLIDSPDAIEQSKHDTQVLLDAIQFKAGSRYEDHQEGDRDSGLGLRALVLGGAGLGLVKAAKAGFLIKLLLIFKKGFIVVFAAIGGFFKWMLGRKKKNADAEPPQDPPPADEPPATPPEV